MLRAIVAASVLTAMASAVMLIAVSLAPAPAPTHGPVATARLAGPPPVTTLPSPEAVALLGRGLQLDVHSVDPVALSREPAEETAELTDSEEPPGPETTLDAEAAPEPTIEATPDPTPAPSPSPDLTPTPLATGAGLLELVHLYLDLQREVAGLGTLDRSAALDAVAAAHAEDLATSGRFSHVGSDGSTLADRLARGGIQYGWAGENLGHSAEANADSLRAIVSGFMNSPTHRANVLAKPFDAIGVALDVAVDGSAILVVVFSD